MVERRPVYGVESTPTTNPPTFVEVAEITDADTPRGVTIGDAFPASPAPYHRHFLTDGVIASTEEWFYWDPTKQGSGRWLSERVITFHFGAAGSIANAALQMPTSGASGAGNGYTAGGRPLLLFASASMQTGGADGSCKFNLYTSAAPTEVAFSTIGLAATQFQWRRDILIPANPLGGSEIFHCAVVGTSGTQPSVTWYLRRTETNP